MRAVAFCFRLCLLCRRSLCGLLGVVALAAEQGPYGVQASVAAACGLFPDQGSNPSPELAGRLLTTEPPGKSCFFFFFCGGGFLIAEHSIVCTFHTSNLILLSNCSCHICVYIYINFVYYSEGYNAVVRRSRYHPCNHKCYGLVTGGRQTLVK